jgi:hypothetical protein
MRLSPGAKKEEIAVTIKINVTYAENGPGWSETYYSSLGNPTDYIQFSSPGILDPICPAGVFLASRLKCLSQQTYLQHIRASLVGSPQVTMSVYIPSPSGRGKYIANAAPFGESAEVFAKLLLRMQCGQTKRRSLWLGGIPEEIVSSPSTYAPTANWNTQLSQFLSLLTTSTYGIVGRLTAAGPPVAQVLQSFTISALSIGATIAPAPTNAPGGAYCYCVLRGIRYPRGWNGVHRGYVNLLQTSIQIGPFREVKVSLPPWDAFAGGTIQLLTFPLTPFTSGFAEYITHRKVGRPFGESRGRLAFR